MGMNINLTSQLEEMVRQEVTSGLYSSASEVVREALRLMAEKDQVRTVRLGQLRQEFKMASTAGQRLRGSLMKSSVPVGRSAGRRRQEVRNCRQLLSVLGPAST